MKQLVFLLIFFASTSLVAQKNTLLDQAFWKNNPDAATVQAEITKGNDPAQLNGSAFDPVVYAINAQAPNESIKLLLQQKGNEVNKLTHDGRTYIFWAASRGNTEIMQYLISKGANVTMEDSHGSTPLGFAAGQSNTKVYDLLINAGANIKQRNREGATLLLQSISNDKDLKLTDYFISKGLSLNDVDASGNTAFNYAARSGNIDLLKTLASKGVKYTDNAMIMATQGSRGGTANGVEVYQYLESLKIKPTVVTKAGENVLHSLVRRPNQLPVINYFISKGVDVNQADAEGNTPLMNAAASNRDTATINLLLVKVKNIDQVNKKGLSALMFAVRGNSAEVTQLILDKKANTKIVDAEGNNLAYYLIQSYSPARAEAFAPKLKALQQAGFDLSTPQKDGNTLYHLAVAKNDIALLKEISALNIDVNSKNKEGLTPLHKAAMVSKDDGMLKYLVSIGAMKESTTEFKETAFDLAKENEAFEKNHISIDFLK